MTSAKTYSGELTHKGPYKPVTSAYMNSPDVWSREVTAAEAAKRDATQVDEFKGYEARWNELPNGIKMRMVGEFKHGQSHSLELLSGHDTTTYLNATDCFKQAAWRYGQVVGALREEKDPTAKIEEAVPYLQRMGAWAQFWKDYQGNPVDEIKKEAGRLSMVAEWMAATASGLGLKLEDTPAHEQQPAQPLEYAEPRAA